MSPNVVVVFSIMLAPQVKSEHQSNYLKSIINHALGTVRFDGLFIT